MTYQLKLDANGYVQGCDLPSPSIVPDRDHSAQIAALLPSGNTWIQTLGGNWLDLANPDPAHINFRHVAMVLARVCRFAGHTERGPYSVAQHCVEGAKAILRDGHGRDAAAAFLLHDAHEAYIGDMPTPLVGALMHYAKDDDTLMMDSNRKAGFVVSRAIQSIKIELDTAIYMAAGVHYPGPHYTLVKLYDLAMLRTERDARLAPPPASWMDAVENAVPVEGCDLYPWSEDVARSAYMEMLRDFGMFVDSPR